MVNNCLKPNSIVIKPEKDAGLCNRIKCIVSAMHLAEMYKARLVLDWKPSFSCGIEFRDLFDNNIENVENINHSDKEDVIEEVNTWKFPDIPKEQILKYLNSLEINNEILKKVEQFSKHTYREVDFKKMVGIHCRRNEFMLSSEKSKSTNDLFFKRIDEIIAQNKDVRFFLATDSKKTEEEFFSRYMGRIITYPKLCLDREKPEAIIEAMIDLLLLSKCNHILGSYLSTYSEMAWWFGNCNAQFEEIGKPKTQQQQSNEGKKTSILSFLNQYFRRNSSLYRKIMRRMGYWA